MADTEDELTAEDMDIWEGMRERAAQLHERLADPVTAQMRALGMYPLSEVDEILLEMFPADPALHPVLEPDPPPACPPAPSASPRS